MEKVFYAKIIALDLKENPLYELQGKIINGSYNLDGSSSIRRTCTLTLVADENSEYVEDDYWSFNTLIELQLSNDGLVWNKHGIYVITSFSQNRNTTGINININAKDKICRLNGEVGGKIPISTNLSTVDEKLSDGTIRKNKLLIKDIIKHMLIEYAQERPENIFIKDLDQAGYELWEYRGESPLYILINANSREIYNLTFNSMLTVYEQGEPKEISKINKYYLVDCLDKQANKNASEISFSKDLNSTKFYVAKIDYGQNAGYHKTDLVYAGDLIAGVGETIDSILKKITNMLGEYEYFYDIYGRFIFQKKPNYLSEKITLLNPKRYSYEFNDLTEVITFAPNPNLSSVKNDLVVWGQKKGISGGNIPIHVRYSIQEKPKNYKNYEGINYSTEEYDWRELIYQMAKDFYKYNGKNDFLNKIKENNPWSIEGRTGYEQYYSDMEAFWRELYNPEGLETEFYIEGDYKYWNRKVYEDPTNLNFWIDFIEPNRYELKPYSVSAIGLRTEVINDNQAKVIYYSKAPEVEYVTNDSAKGKEDFDYIKMQIPEYLERLFSISSQGQSLLDKINSLIYKHICIPYGLTLTIIPNFTLQPNTKIYIKGYGDFIVNKISCSLSHDATMTLTTSKVIEEVLNI